MSDLIFAPNAHPLWLHLAAFLASKAEKTKITYEGILKEWCQFLKAPIGTTSAAHALLRATHLHAIAFQEWLKKQPGSKPRLITTPSTSKAVTKERLRETRDGLQSTQSNATIWKKSAALRRMYRVFVAAGLGISENPFDADRAPPPPKDSGKKRPTEMIDFGFVEAIINAPDRETIVGRRDRAILGLLFGAGLRRSEVAGLRIGDVRKTSSGNFYIYLRSTKAKKDAEQPISPWSAPIVWEWLKERENAGAQSGDYLFVALLGRNRSALSSSPISHTAIWRLFRRYCMMAGTGGFKSPHSARATAITKLLTDGIPHRLVQAFSRHASIQMVEVYDKRRLTLEENPALTLTFGKGK